MADNYQCTLDKASIVKAREELHETPEERLGALQTLKDWIQQQPWLKTPMDSSFLINFLRAKKCSQLEARYLLERYWIRRNKYASWCKGIDPADSLNLKFLRDTLSHVPLPGRDKNGRKVVMTRFGQIDTSGKSYSYDQFMRAFLPVFDTLLRDENVQVNGIVVLIDFTSTTIKLQSWIGLDNIRKQMDLVQKAYPVRVKQINYYNTGVVFEAVFGMIRQFISEKISSRIKIHGQSLVSVYEQIDMFMLPVEYLPDDYKGSSAGSVKDIIENFIRNELLEPNNLAFLRDLYNGPYGVDILKKPKDDEPQASFRKLNVD
ncbi:hypothetical protein ACJMK2_010533 [Sinanodonta woodiana]|uniref:CRAL-TRIO domain-containing protein n=1 Tax=Sinanodonta woodiana TaxID=1069815 RepID=A0ABD3VFQ7_SINWO